MLFRSEPAECLEAVGQFRVETVRVLVRLTEAANGEDRGRDRREDDRPEGDARDVVLTDLSRRTGVEPAEEPSGKSLWHARYLARASPRVPDVQFRGVLRDPCTSGGFRAGSSVDVPARPLTVVRTPEDVRQEEVSAPWPVRPPRYSATGPRGRS